MSNSKERIRLIEQQLDKALSPTHLKITDESYKHHGHVGANTGLGHFAIEITAPIFTHKNSLQCHRLIYDALGTLMKTDIHALRIKIIK